MKSEGSSSKAHDKLHSVPGARRSRSLTAVLNNQPARSSSAQPTTTTNWKYLLRANTMFLLARFNGRFAFLLFAYLVCSYFHAFTRVTLPNSTGKIIDAIILEKPHEEFWDLITSLLRAIGKSVVFFSLEKVCFNLLQEKITLNLRRVICSSIVKAKAAYLRDPNLLSNLQEDSKMVCKLATFSLLMELYVEFGLFKTRITSLFDISQSWMTCVLIMHPIFTLIARTADKSLSKKIAKLNKLNEKTTKAFSQKIGGMVLTKIHNSAKVTELQRQLEEILLESDARESRKAVLSALLQAIPNGLQRLGEIIMLIYGSVLLIRKELSPGNFAVFIIKTVNISDGPKALLRIFDELNKGSGNCKRFFDFVEHAEEADKEIAEDSDDESSAQSLEMVKKTQSDEKPAVEEEIPQDNAKVRVYRKPRSSTNILKTPSEPLKRATRKRHTTMVQVKTDFEDENGPTKLKIAPKTVFDVFPEESPADESSDPVVVVADRQFHSVNKKKEMWFKFDDEVRFRKTISNREASTQAQL